MAKRVDITVPDIGDFSDVEVVEVLVAPGDRVEIEDPLVTLETDKASMDVPATHAGTVVEVKVQAGDTVSQGDEILVVEATGSAAETATEIDPDEQEFVSTEVLEEPVRSAAAGSGDVQSVFVPDIGDFSEVEVIEVLVQAGADIAADDSLVTLESDKAAMDVPSPFGGRVKSVRVKTGDKVSEGDLIAEVENAVPAPGRDQRPASDRTVKQPTLKSAPPAKPEPRPAAAPPRAAGLPPIDETGFATAHAGPSVRKLARELGVDLGSVKGTGLKGRVTQPDVKAFVKAALSGQSGVPAGGGAALPAVPVVDFSKFGPVETKPLTRIQKISGPRLHASWVNLPHVTQYDEADITELEQARKQLKTKAVQKGIKLTPLAFIIRACVLALQKFPKFNTSLSPEGDALVYKQYVNVGFAADTPNGLMVPVIHDADKQDVYELASSLGTLSEKAREAKLGPKEMQGGTFTVSSLGGIGGTAFTPIINAPEVAILGVSRSKMTPVYQDGQFVPRLVLPFSLSYDHRVIDGADGARFTSYLSEALTDVRALLEAIP